MPDEPTLPEKLLCIERGFAAERIPHAFGGAIALAYYATPRATIDIDVNVFLETAEAERLLGVLERLGVDPASPAQRHALDRDGQARLFWGRTPVDVFLAYDPFHDACLERRHVMPFGDDSLHVLAAEDLVVFKVIFDRDKDWRDIEELLFAMGDELEATRVSEWLERILDPADPRLARWRKSLDGVA